MDGHKEILTMALAFCCFSTVGWFIEGSPGLNRENTSGIKLMKLG